ncbi:MAG TPA: 3-deoxy-8-phosphooctulonate synthase [Thermodesulfobacteriota bacterium]|nr:3-deoxy-8-phosphooctulonate synthase [Thermodesulfobacteriota bacterium]
MKKLEELFKKEGAPLFFIMGPCVIEDEATTLKTLEGLLKVTEDLGVPFVFKTSYDKANRTSLNSYRGPGLEKGLEVLRKAKLEYPEVPLLTDVHCRSEVGEVASVVDIIQIPAFLCRQTNLIVEAALTEKVINIKKGQFMAPGDIRHSVEKVLSTGNDRIIITERGVSFGYNNLVVDFRAFPVMRALGFPVVFDATHSVQSPGGMGTSSGGDRTMARYLARAAAGCGVDGFFMEVHPDPEKALCDGPNSIALKDVKEFIEEITEIDQVVRKA